MPQHTASPIEPLDDGGLRLALSRREMTTPLDPYQGLYVRGQHPMIGQTAFAFDIKINITAIAQRSGDLVRRLVRFARPLG